MRADNACKPDRMAVERLFAYGFVGIGGVFWASAVFGADYGYSGLSPMVSARNALFPLALTLGVLAVGWFFERAAAVLLVLTAAGVVVWGALTGWEPGVWSLVTVTLIGPMLVSAVLYWLAARMQRVCDLEQTTAPAERAVTA